MLTRYRHQDIQTLEHIHLLEASPVDQRVHFPLAASVQEHQPTLCANQQIHTCFKNTQPYMLGCACVQLNQGGKPALFER